MKKYVFGISLIALAVIVATTVWSSRSSKPVSSAVPNKGVYVALGDSVAAGVGLNDYSDSSACDRTLEAYPNKVASQLHYTLVNVACSGATTQQGILGAQEVNQLNVAPQLGAVLKAPKPSLITITIGANDANWIDAIQKCYTNVCGSDADTNAVQAGITSAVANLEQTLAQIKSTYPTATPHVVLTGYYKLFPAAPAADCQELSGIEPTELLWIRQLQTSIDSSLQTVASHYDFTTFVPLSLSSHELCTTDPWIQGLGGKAPYHPTAAGQSAIASQIINALTAKRN